jgi:hypothetical protein
MAVYNTRQSGFATLGELAISLMSKLVTGSGTWNGTTGTKLGFKLVYPATGEATIAANYDVNTGYIKTTTIYTPTGGTATPVARWIFECTTDIDVKTTTTQATTFGATVLTDGWRICIEFPLEDSIATAVLATAGTTVFKEFVAVYVGTSVQLRNDGTVVALPYVSSVAGGGVAFVEPAGNVGAPYRTITLVGSGGGTLVGGATSATAALKPEVNSAGVPQVGITASWDIGFYNRIGVTRDSGYAIPLSYELTMSKRGVFFGVWDLYSEQSGAKFNWVLVQRSVDRASGAIRGRAKTTETGAVATFLDETATSVAPLWCVNCVNNKYYKFNPREQDIGGPGRRTSATDNSEDNTAIINPFDQQSLTDDSKYVITFLSNLNTTRFKYPDELDLVGTVSSDVIGAGTEATVTVYNESPVDRVYRALPPNAPYGTGMRIVSLARFAKTIALGSPSSSASGTVTLTYAAAQTTAPFVPGSNITVAGFTSTAVAFNGTFPVVTCSTTTVTYTITTTTSITASTYGTVTGVVAGGPISETPT